MIDQIDFSCIPIEIARSVADKMEAWLLVGGRKEDAFIKRLTQYLTDVSEGNGRNGYERRLSLQMYFDIPLFCYGKSKPICESCLRFYNVEFPFQSMQKYDGKDVSLNLNGDIIIYDIVGDKQKILWKGFAFDIPEYATAYGRRGNKNK